MQHVQTRLPCWRRRWNRRSSRDGEGTMKGGSAVPRSPQHLHKPIPCVGETRQEGHNGLGSHDIKLHRPTV